MGKHTAMAALLALSLALACSGGSPVPSPVVDEIAESLVGIAHPKATFQSATVGDWSMGGLEDESDDRYVDLVIHYLRDDGSTELMVVKLKVKSVDPCRISVDVLSDSGPSPAILDNAIVSRLVGDRICAAFTP